jgi:RNA polymerase sigma-70 factor (ECF subfamily)
MPEVELERLFEASYRRLVSEMTLIAGSRAAAEDCVQEAFARAFTRWRRVRKLDNPGAWVRRVAINLALSQRRGVRRRACADGWQGQLEGRATMDWANDHMDLNMALRLLTEPQRAVVVLYYLHDMSISEVAEMLGRPEGTVKAQLSRARKSMAISMADREGTVRT